MTSITEFGAEAGGALCTTAIQTAIDRAAEQGGGTVRVPAGTFLTGALRLRDNVELHLDPGAVLKFSDNPDDFPIVSSRWEGVLRDVHASCVYAQDARNISITGRGTLDGSGARWWDVFRNRRDELKAPRPKLIGLDGCENVLLRDVTLRNSPAWTVHPLRCNNVTCQCLTIQNPADSPNTDGIDPESCTNVRILGCHIDVGDDCIAVKAGTEDTAERVACENITITGCTMVHGHGGVVLGSEMTGGIRNVTVSSCVFQDTDRGIRLKSRRGRGGAVEDLRVSNIVMDRVLCPFIVNLYYFCGPKGKERLVWDKNPYPVTEETPAFRRLHFSDITAREVHACAGFIYGLAERYASEITFHNVSISMAENATPARPAMMSGIGEMARRGFYVGFAEDVVFSDVTVENHDGPAFYLEGTRRVTVRDCASRAPRQADAKLVEEGSVSHD